VGRRSRPISQTASADAWASLATDPIAAAAWGYDRSTSVAGRWGSELQPQDGWVAGELQHGTDRVGLALQDVAQPLGHREHPLAHRQGREDVINRMRGGFGHAPGAAGGQTPRPVREKATKKS